MAKYYSPDGNLEVWDKKPDNYYTIEEWEALHPAPPTPEPTTEEKLEALDAQYKQDKDDLMQAYLNALIYGNNDLADEIKEEISALDDKYDEDYEELISEDEEGEE